MEANLLLIARKIAKENFVLRKMRSRRDIFRERHRRLAPLVQDRYRLFCTYLEFISAQQAYIEYYVTLHRMYVHRMYVLMSSHYSRRSRGPMTLVATRLYGVCSIVVLYIAGRRQKGNHQIGTYRRVTPRACAIIRFAGSMTKLPQCSMLLSG